MKTAQEYLNFLNKEYARLHKKYEDLFWLSYMGDHSVDDRKDKALANRNAFQADPKNLRKAQDLLEKADAKMKKRLALWIDFFERYQVPSEALPLKEKIDKIESIINQKHSERQEGYIDPYTKKHVKSSMVEMRMMTVTHDDEKIRKACFEAREKMSTDVMKEYIQLVGLRNEYARHLGYTDFYDFKIQTEEGMTKKELFSILDSIYEKTKYAKKDIIELEKEMPGLRKPWNFGYMMAGDFTKEEDPYFQFDMSLERWGRSFMALGIGFARGTLRLDLLDRKGKWNNGFCHWPDIVKFEKGKKVPGSTNFTCNVVFGQVGSGDDGYNTLFHEGGHAAHLLNSDQVDVCVNHEYPPMSTAWAETQSMFLDTMFNSIEWSSRYAQDRGSNPYPFDLFKRRVIKLNLMRPLGLNGIISVAGFEKEIYESKKLDSKKIIVLAKKTFRKYFERSEDSLTVLNTPHIYSWESACSYHGYGLATLALNQWREYFFKKYGYIVDNPNVGKEMQRVWALAASKTFKEFVIMATGKKLSADAYLKNATASVDGILKIAKKRIKRLEKIKPYGGKIDLDASIYMVSGKKEIANNKKSFEDMAAKYKKWLETQRVPNK